MVFVYLHFKYDLIWNMVCLFQTYKQMVWLFKSWFCDFPPVVHTEVALMFLLIWIRSEVHKAGNNMAQWLDGYGAPPNQKPNHGMMSWYDSMIWYDMVWYGMIWYDMVWYFWIVYHWDIIHHGTIWRGWTSLFQSTTSEAGWIHGNFRTQRVRKT